MDHFQAHWGRFGDGGVWRAVPSGGIALSLTKFGDQVTSSHHVKDA